MTEPVTTDRKPGLRAETVIFLGLAVFFFVGAIVYGFWTAGDSPTHLVETGGTVALALSGGLCLIVGSFLWFAARRMEGERPEDDLQAEVADGAGEMGFFPPASYWPFAMAFCAAVTAFAVAFWLVWLLVIGAGFLLGAITGLLFEYHRRYAAH